MAPPGGETALDQSESAPKSVHLNDNRGFHVAPPGGNKRTTNQNAPFQISTNQNEPQNLHIFKPSKTHTTQGLIPELSGHEDFPMPLSHAFSKAEDVYQLKNRAIRLVAAQKVGLEVTIYIIMIQTGNAAFLIALLRWSNLINNALYRG